MVRLTDRPDMTLDVYHGRKTTMQQCNNSTQFLALIGQSVAESIETLDEDTPSDHSFHCMTDNIDSK